MKNIPRPIRDLWPEAFLAAHLKYPGWHPMFKKTGTTIVGLKFAGGVGLFSDTRATMGDVVEDKNCFKLHRLSEQIHCAGAGTAADTDRLTRTCERLLATFQRKYCRAPFVSTAIQFMTSHLHKYRGAIGAALIVAGVDQDGAHLFDVYPHGSASPSPFTSLGSGSLAAMSILETGFRESMAEEEAVALGTRAIESGVLNDLYSGSNVDYLLITAQGTRVFRNAKKVCEKGSAESIRYPPSSVKITKEEVFDWVEEIFE